MNYLTEVSEDRVALKSTLNSQFLITQNWTTTNGTWRKFRTVHRRQRKTPSAWYSRVLISRNPAWARHIPASTFACITRDPLSFKYIGELWGQNGFVVTILAVAQHVTPHPFGLGVPCGLVVFLPRGILTIMEYHTPPFPTFIEMWCLPSTLEAGWPVGKETDSELGVLGSKTLAL